MSGQNVHNKWTRTLAATAKCDWCSSKNLILQRCGVCHINVCQECMAKGVLEDNQHQVARSAVGDWDWEKPQGSGSQYSAQGRDRGTARSVVSRENGVHSSQSPRPSPWLEHAPVVHSPAPSAFPVFRNNPRGYFGGPQMALGSEAGRPTMMPDPGFVQTLQRPGYYGVPERMSQAWFGPTASYPSWNRPFIRRGQTSNQKHAQKQPNEAPQSSRQPAHTLNSLLPSMSPTTTKKRSRPQTPSDEGVMGEDSGRRSAVRRKSENVQCETVSAGKRPEDHSAENISLNSKPSENTAPEKRPSTQSPTAVKEISEKLPENTSCITEHLDKDDASLDKHDKEAAMILVAMSRGLHQLEAHTEDREARRSPPNADDTSGKTPEDDDPSSSSPCQLLSQLSSEASGASATPRALSHGSSQTARTGESTHVFSFLPPWAHPLLSLFFAH